MTVGVPTADRPNARRLKPLAAVIDLGSNAVRLVVFERRGDRGLLPTEWKRQRVRLSEGMDRAGGVLQSEPMERTLAVLERFASACDAWAVRPVAVATSAVRDARNRAAFVARVAAETGLPLRVLSTA